MRIENCKNPREKHPPQDVNHPPPAGMKYTEEAGVLVPDSAARWRARGGHLRTGIFNAATKEKIHEKRKNYSPTSQTNTPTHVHTKSVINVKIQHHINQAAKT